MKMGMIDEMIAHGAPKRITLRITTGITIEVLLHFPLPLKKGKLNLKPWSTPKEDDSYASTSLSEQPLSLEGEALSTQLLKIEK